MNAPRQGLFASLLIISFALHVIIIVNAALEQLSDTRAIQGELMTRQLAEDSLASLTPVDTVSLALLGNRYAARPDVASLKIMATDGRVLTTSGASPTREGQVFQKKIMLDQHEVGDIELVLIKPSIGEMIRNQWLPLLLSLLIHVVLWLSYRVIARPTRQEYLDSLARERQLQEQIQVLRQQVDSVEKNAALARATAQAVEEIDDPEEPLSENPFVLHIGFADPKQLLGTLSPGLAQPYFNLCQTLLEQAIEQTRLQFTAEQIQVKVLQSFGERGAVVSASGPANRTALFLSELGKLMNVLTDAVYRRHREIKRFALHTRCALAEQQGTQPAQALAQQLLEYVQSNELAIHLSDDRVLQVQQHFQLASLPNPMNAQTREALMVIAMNVDCAKFVEQARDRILCGEKKEAAVSTTDEEVDG